MPQKGKIYKKLAFTFYKNYLNFFFKRKLFFKRFFSKFKIFKKFSMQFRQYSPNSFFKNYFFNRHFVNFHKNLAKFRFFKNFKSQFSAYWGNRSAPRARKFSNLSILLQNNSLRSKFNGRLSSNSKLIFILKQKIFTSSVAKLLKLLTSDNLNFKINFYNINNFVTKSRKRQRFERRLVSAIKTTASKKMLHVLKKGFFSLSLAVKLLG